MKKMIAAAALVGLASAVFGQTAPTLTLGGALNTGVAAQFNGNDKAQVGLWDDAAGEWKPVGRFKLTGKADMGASGVAFDLRADGLTQGINTVVLKSVYAYANFFDKMVYTQVGIINEQTLRPKGDAGWTFTKEVPGAVILVKPVDGLAVEGAVVNSYDSTQATGFSNNFTNFADANSVAGASYTIPGVGAIMGQALFANNYSVNSSSSKTYTYGLAQAYIAGNVTAVQDLGLWVEAFWGGFGSSKPVNLGDGKQDGFTSIDEQVSYDLKNAGAPGVTVGLVSYQFLYGSDLKTNAGADSLALSYSLQPWVSYALDGGAVAKLSAAYISGAEAATGCIYGYGVNSFDNVIGKNVRLTGTNYNKIATFGVTPSITLPLAKNQNVILGVNYTTSVGSDKVAFMSTSTSSTSLTTLLAAYNFSF